MLDLRMGLISCTQVVQVVRGGSVLSTVHHQLEIVGLVKSMTVQEALIRYSWNSSGVG